mgnify:CR=1 FL=1
MLFRSDDVVVNVAGQPADITMFVYSTTSGAASTVPANWKVNIPTCEMIYKAEVYDGFLTGVSGLN